MTDAQAQEAAEGAGVADPTPTEAGPSPSRPETLPGTPAAGSFVDRLPWWTVPALLIGVPLLFAGIAHFSASFAEHVVWRYYWGPIKADAAGCAHMAYAAQDRCAFGNPASTWAASGYNVVNTVSWAALLGVCIVGAAQVLRFTRTAMTPKVIVGATLWVVAGSLFHVLEDTGLMGQPLQYFIITPPIYLLFAAIAVGTLVLGHYLRGVAERASVGLALQKLWLVLCVPVLGYLILWNNGWAQVTHYVNPVWVALFALAPFLAVRAQWRRQGRVDPAGLVGWMSLGWLLLGIAYTVSFVMHPWLARSPVPLAWYAPLLALAVVLVAYGIALATVGGAERKGHTKRRDFALALLSPINMLLLFSQMLDGWATSIGIDFGPYTEKHVLSRAIIDVTQGFGERTGLSFVAHHPTFIGFATVKLAVSLFVIYAIDAGNAQERERYPTLIGLVKFAIIMVGIGPGIRDFVRMGLGV